MLPYTYDVNDFKFFVAPGFGSSMAYFEHAKNAFDTLYEEGQEGHPAYLTVALHARVIGRPGRFPAIKQVRSSILVFRNCEIYSAWYSSWSTSPPNPMSGLLHASRSRGTGRDSSPTSHQVLQLDLT